MGRKSRTRYLNLIYLIVASIAIILVLVGFNYLEGSSQSIVLNLSTELLGVVLIFFLVQRFFFIEELDTSDRVEKLLSRLEQHTNFLKGPEENEPIKKLIAGRSDIWLLGETFARVVKTDNAYLTERINAGARLKLIILDPDSEACQLILDNSIIKDIQRNIKSSLEYCQNIAEKISDGSKGKIEVKLLNWVPSCSMIILDPKKENGYCRVTIYPPYYPSPISDRAHFILQKDEENRWYDTFVKQFEYLWSQAQPFNLELEKGKPNNAVQADAKARRL